MGGGCAAYVELTSTDTIDIYIPTNTISSTEVVDIEEITAYGTYLIS